MARTVSVASASNSLPARSAEAGSLRSTDGEPLIGEVSVDHPWETRVQLPPGQVSRTLAQTRESTSDDLLAAVRHGEPLLPMHIRLRAVDHLDQTDGRLREPSLVETHRPQPGVKDSSRSTMDSRAGTERGAAGQEKRAPLTLPQVHFCDAACLRDSGPYERASAPTRARTAEASPNVSVQSPASAASRSSMRSATSSMPTERRSRFSGTASSVPRTEAWVISCG